MNDGEDCGESDYVYCRNEACGMRIYLGEMGSEYIKHGRRYFCDKQCLEEYQEEA